MSGDGVDGGEGGRRGIKEEALPSKSHDHTAQNRNQSRERNRCFVL